MRLANAHGIPELPEMLLQFGIPWFKLAQGKQVDVAAQAAGIDFARLLFDSGRVSNGEVLLRGERLYRAQWSVHAGRRACFECLADDPIKGTLPRRWHRAWWDVQPLTVCIVHRAPLLGSCPRCRERLDFTSTSIESCPNGHALVQASGCARLTECSGDAYLSGRLGAIPRVSCDVLDAGTLGQAIRALDFVGAAALKGHALREARDLKRHMVLDAGYRVFAAWPAALDSILDRLLANSNIGPGRWGSAAAYGAFHNRLYELQNDPIAAILKQRIRRHAIANGVAISRTVFGVIEAGNDLCSIKEAAGQLSLGFDRARREFARRGLVPAGTRRGTPVAIPRAAVENLLSERLDTVTVKQLAQDLRIGRTQARKLAAAGLFGPRGALRRSELDAFLHKISSRAPKRMRRGGVSLPRACRSARFPIEAAVAAILDARAPLAGYRSGQGLGGIYARISDLRALGKSRRDAMTIGDAARTLRLRWETVKALTRLRLLRADNHGIARAAIEAFRADFVAGAHLARAAGLGPRTLMKIMSEAGICPAAAPPRCRQVFYRRNEITNASQFGSKHPLVHAAAFQNRAP